MINLVINNFLFCKFVYKLVIIVTKNFLALKFAIILEFSYSDI